MLPFVKPMIMTNGSGSGYLIDVCTEPNLTIYDPGGLDIIDLVGTDRNPGCAGIFYNNVPRDENLQVYVDMGTNYFGSTFEIKFEMDIESCLLYGMASLLSLSNVAPQSQAQLEATTEGMNLKTSRNLNKVLWRLRDEGTGNEDSSYSVASFSTNTPRLWCNFIRNPVTTLTMQWWEDADRTSKYIGDSVITCDSFDKFRYIYLFQNRFQAGKTDTIRGYGYNYEIISPLVT